MFETFLFAVLAVVTTLTAILVIVQRNPVASAIYLIITIFCLAGIYLLLNAQFIAIIQVLVYAGAIMVLFLFVIMLLNLEKEQKRTITRHRLQRVLGIFLGAVLLAQIGMIFHSFLLGGRKGIFPPEKVAGMGNTETVARLLFTDYLLPFEITSVLLLVAIIGAIVLAKKQI